MADFYLDFSLAAGGTGAFATPWGRLSDIAGTAPGDTVWCRRTTFTDTTQAPTYSTSIPSGVAIVGWPLAGDSRFSTRPVAARSAWDGDAGTHATIIHNPPAGGTATVGAEVTSFVPVAGRQYVLARFKLRRNCTGSVVNGLIGWFATQAFTTGGIFTTENCSFEIDQGSGTASYYTLIGCSVSPSNFSYLLSLRWVDIGSSFFASSSSVSCQVFGFGSGSSSTSALLLSCAFTLATFRTSGVSGSTWHTRSGNGASSALDGTFDRCTFDHTVARTATNFWPIKPASTSPAPVVFSRCTFTTPPGTNGFNRFDTHNFHYYECDWVGFNSLNINDSGARVTIRRFVQGNADTTQPAIYVSAGGHYVPVGYASFASGTLRDVSFLGQTVGGSPTEAIGGGTVHLRSVNESGAGYALATNGRIIAQDINGAVGTWKRITLVGTAQAVSAYRSGGARYGIQLLPALSNYAAVEGCPTEEPGFETLRVPLQPGVNTVTVYCAHVGYATAPTAQSVWLEVEAPLVTSRQLATTRDYAGPALTADTSKWNGVSGSPTFFRLAVTMTVDTQCVGAIRVYAGDGNGSVFVDPKPVVS